MGIFGNNDQETTTSVDLNPYAKQYLTPGLDASRKLLQQGAPDWYNFETVAGIDPRTQQSWQQQMQFGNGGMGSQTANALQGAGMNQLGLYNQYMGGLSGQQAPQITTAGINQFYNSDLVNSQLDQIEQRALTNLDRNVMPSIGMGSGGAGQSNSSRRGIAEGIAMGDTMTGIANAQTGLMSDYYRQAAGLAGQNAGLQQNNQQMIGGLMSGLGSQGANNLGQSYGMGWQNALIGQGVGDQARAYEQEKIADRQNQHNWSFDQNRNLIGQYMQMASPLFNMTNTTSETSGGGMGWGSQLLGIGSQLGAAALMPGR